MTDSQSQKQKNDIKDFFNTGADRWKSRYVQETFDAHNYRDRMQAAIDFLSSYAKPGMLLLDAGCGTGVQAAKYQELGFRVIACDISSEMAQHANKALRHGGGVAVIADLDAVPFVAHSFDVICALGVISYAEHPHAFLQSLSRLLRPGGLLIISSFNTRLLIPSLSSTVSYLPDVFYLYLKKLFRPDDRIHDAAKENFYADHAHPFMPAEFDALLESSGFRKIASRGVNFGTPHFMGKRLLSEPNEIRLSRFFSRVSNWRILQFLQSYAKTYIVCAEKVNSLCSE